MGKELPIEIFMPPNMLKAKAGRTSVNGDMAAILRAEAALELLKDEIAVGAEELESQVIKALGTDKPV